MLADLARSLEALSDCKARTNNHNTMAALQFQLNSRAYTDKEIASTHTQQ